MKLAKQKKIQLSKLRKLLTQSFTSKHTAKIDEIFQERESLNTLSHNSITKLNPKAENLSVYAGFDPTSGKLHLGNLAQIISLIRAGQAGFRPIGLIGGATARIGDPSGKNSERNLLSFDEVDKNRQEMGQQLGRLCRNVINVANKKSYGDLAKIDQEEFSVVDNYDFYSGMNVLDFLTKVGKNFSVNTMSSRHSVASRLESGDGISFTEFSYQVLQGYDFHKLFKNQNCVLQIGGSDQWGNISSGIDLVRRLNRKQVYGLTTNLLVTKEGKKFGKSEGNAIWVDESTESLLALHNYVMSLADDQIPGLMKSLTFLEIQEIEKIEKLSQDGVIRAQELLSRELLEMVSGAEKKADSVLRYKEYFKLKFNEIKKLPKEKVIQNFEGILKCRKMTLEEFENFPSIEEIMIELGVRDSFNQIRKIVKGNGLAINGQKVTRQKMKIENYELISDTLWVVKYGKRDYLSLLVV